jgi:hypothetical protein
VSLENAVLMFLFRIPPNLAKGLAIINRTAHNHSVGYFYQIVSRFQLSADQYDEFGRSIHLNQLFEATDILRKAGCDTDEAFGVGMNEHWIKQQVSVYLYFVYFFV